MDIKKTIKAHGWTISALAASLGVSQSALTQNINGNPSLSRLQEMADVIGITVSELLSNDDEKAKITCPHCGKPIEIDVKS